MNTPNLNSNNNLSPNPDKFKIWSFGSVILFIAGIAIGLFIAKGISVSYDRIFAPNQEIRPWEKEEITYYNDTEYDKSLQVAIYQWERTGIPVDFTETSSPEKADLLVIDDEEALQEECPNKLENCIGLATIGYAPNYQARMTLTPAKYEDHEIVDFSYVPVIVHELGHVLGLEHNTYACSVMAENLSHCRVRATPLADNRGTTYFCGPIESDIRDIRKFYGLSEEVPYETSGYCLDDHATADFFNKEAESHLVDRSTRDGKRQS